MDKIKIFKTPYTRPLKLSDPHNDFTKIGLAQIINTPDENMGWREFRDLFQVGLPAGTYKECCYFLPHALRYIALNPEDGSEFLSGIIWFISENTNNLAGDNILEACIEAINNCFGIWTNEFTIEHYDKEACQKKQWSLDYDDIVKNSQIVTEALDDLTFYRSLENIAFDFIEDLRTSSLAVKAAWYIELSIFDNTYGFIRSEKLKKMISDKNYLEKCIKIVKGSSLLKISSSPTYWKDVFEKLSIP